MARPPLITREKVAEVAIRLLDEEGVQGLSLDRIGNELGVRGPSLYHHYHDKAAILDDVADAILGKLTLEHESDDWQEWLVQVCLALYRRVLRHPNVAHLVLEHLSPQAVTAGFGRAAQRVQRAGVDPTIQVLLLEGVHFLVWGQIMHRTLMATSPRVKQDRPARHWPELEAGRSANQWNDEQQLERSVRAFIAGALDMKD